MKNQVNGKIGIIYLICINILSFLCMFFIELNTVTQVNARVIEEIPITTESVEVQLEEYIGDPPTDIKVINLNYDDLKYLSSIIYCEAGNQCEAGKEAVGIVVVNRVSDERFEDTIKGVIYQEGQFSPVSSGSFNSALRMFENQTLPKDCIEAALEVLEGKREVEYEGETYNIDYLYFARSLDKAQLTIEDHDFK